MPFGKSAFSNLLSLMVETKVCVTTNGDTFFASAVSVWSRTFFADFFVRMWVIMKKQLLGHLIMQGG